jgi:hypothetical protein
VLSRIIQRNKNDKKMKIAVSHSRKENPAQAAKEAFERLTAKMAVPIHMLLVYYTEALDPGIIAGTLSELAPNVPIHGGSTSQGILTDAGFIAGRPGALGLLGIFDPDGQYGTAFCDYAEGAYQAGVSAIQKSLQNAGRPGESPLLVWMTATPGKEEEVIAGIQSVVGPHVTVLGGTAADDTISAIPRPGKKAWCSHPFFLPRNRDSPFTAGIHPPGMADWSPEPMTAFSMR